jgi:hypothetical protein
LAKNTHRLIVPVQRIPRYVLLLEDMVKNTWENHKDLPNLQLALEKLKQAVRIDS